MYGKLVEEEEYEALLSPLGVEHPFVELWRVECHGRDTHVEFVDYFPSVMGATRWATHLGSGTYHMTAADGRVYMVLDLGGG